MRSALALKPPANPRTWLCRPPLDYDSAHKAGTYLLALPRDERPTAIFASSDQQAIGCIRAAGDLGIPIPTALSIVSFDGIHLAEIVTPRLTAVRQPVREIAFAAVEAILQGDVSGAQKLFDCELVEGESTASPMTSPVLL